MSKIDSHPSLLCQDYSPSRPHSLEGWPVFERNGLSAASSDVKFGDNIHDPIQRMGPFERLSIFA